MATATTEPTYSTGTLDWFAKNYGDTEWMVHVAGPDDCRTHADPELDDDNPNNPLFTQETAFGFAEGVKTAARTYLGEVPDVA